MTDDDLIPRTLVSRQEFLRWSACGVVALLTHVVLVAAVFARPDFADPEAGSPVVMVELAPVAAAPSTVRTDQRPAPQVQTEAQARAQQETRRERQPDQEQIEQTPPRDTDVALPQRLPDPQPEQEQKVEQRAQDASEAAAPQSADVLAALPTGPTPGVIAKPSAAALARWELSLKARIEAVKRYPMEARGAKGVVRVLFRIDRTGHVRSSTITESSGSAALDAETLATIKRADPFPAPPAGTGDEMLAIRVPVEYKLPHTR